MILLKNRKTKNTNDYDEYKEETSKLRDGNESIDNSEIHILFVMVVLSRQPKKKKHLFNG